MTYGSPIDMVETKDPSIFPPPLQTRPRLLFAFPFDATFITTDLELLRTFCNVSVLRFHKRSDYARLLHEMRRTDVVYCWFALPFAAAAGCLARSSGRLSVLATGGWDVARLPAFGYGRPLTVRGAATARIALSMAHSVLAFSESSADMIRGIAPRCAVRTAYLGVDHKQFYPKPKEDFVVTVANISSENVIRKGLREFVVAAGEFPHIPFVVIGRHIDNAVDQLRTVAPRNVSFAGWLASDELRDMLSRAKVYVQASFTEGFGVALAEAMASGCVPVVTRRGAIPEVVGDAGVYVEYGEPQSLVAGIRSAFKEDLGGHARERILNRFTLAHRLATLREVILGSIGESHSDLEEDASAAHLSVEGT